MCNMASFVLTRDHVFWSRSSDSHEDIINEYGLCEGIGASVRPNILRCEIKPPNNDYRLPVDQWVWYVDQDVMPQWHDAARDEARCRAALVEWEACKIHRNERVELTGVASAVCIDCEVVLSGQSGGEVVLCDTSTGTVSGQSGGEVVLYNTSSATVSGQSGGKVWLRDSSSATVSGQSGGEVWLRDSSSATVSGQRGGEVVLCDTSTATVSGQRGGEVWLYDSSSAEGGGPQCVTWRHSS